MLALVQTGLLQESGIDRFPFYRLAHCGVTLVFVKFGEVDDLLRLTTSRFLVDPEEDFFTSF